MGHIALRHMGVRTLHFATQTITGLTANLSMVDTLAFITNPSTDLGQYAGCKITLIDTAGKKAIGWLGAKGTGESLGDDVLSGTGAFSSWSGSFPNEAPSGWIRAGTADANNYYTQDPAGQCRIVRETNATYPAKTSVFSVGGLYYHTIDVNALVGIGSIAHYAAGTIFYISSTGSKSFYYVSTNLGLAVYPTSNNNSITVDNYIIKQVLTPSATGATILSTLGGAQSFWFKDSTFNPNSATFTAIVEG